MHVYLYITYIKYAFYYALSFSLKKEESPAICNSSGESGRRGAQGGKTARKGDGHRVLPRVWTSPAQDSRAWSAGCSPARVASADLALSLVTTGASSALDARHVKDRSYEVFAPHTGNGNVRWWVCSWAWLG